MRILLTNDDGIAAEGLLAFAESLSSWAELYVVAPEKGCSCCGHSVTMTRPLSTREVGDRRFAVDGFPADCIRVALKHLNLKPDWVLSGINHGGNLGVDIVMSGTVAAAREARMLGVPSIAFSQYRKPNMTLSWDVSASRALDVFRWLCDMPNQDHHFWNVNLPALDASHPIPNPSFCSIDTSPFEFRLEGDADALNYRGDYHNRPRAFGSDVATCFAGIPSVSAISIREVR